jgi:hypothetical protein
MATPASHNISGSLYSGTLYSGNSSLANTGVATKTFYIEDTNEGCYRDVTAELVRLQWTKTSAYATKKARSKQHNNRLLPSNGVGGLAGRTRLPSLVWTINEKNIDFEELVTAVNTRVNHFEGISVLNTKLGLCELLRDANWSIASDVGVELVPKCYSLGDPVQREEFVDEYKLNAAVNILKRFVCGGTRMEEESENSSLKAIEDNDALLDLCLSAVTHFVRYKHRGIHDYVDGKHDNCTAEGIPAGSVASSGKHASTSSSKLTVIQDACINNENTTNSANKFTLGLNEGEWTRILDASSEYANAHTSTVPYSLDLFLSRFDAKELSRCGPRMIKCVLLLRRVLELNPQFNCSGTHNIWIVKAPEACRGVGMKLLCVLEDILECERGFGGRVVQKYVECPLLAPMMQAPIPRPFGTIPTASVCKFDMRVWVLVTSFNPLKAHIYTHVYGRKCSSAYTTSAAQLSDSAVHLTNYSVQRKLVQGNTQSTSSPSPALSSKQAQQLQQTPTPTPQTWAYSDPTDGDTTNIELATEFVNLSSAANACVSPRVSRLRNAVVEVRNNVGNVTSNQDEVMGESDLFMGKLVVVVNIRRCDLTCCSCIVAHHQIVGVVREHSRKLRQKHSGSHSPSERQPECSLLGCSCPWCAKVFPQIKTKISASLQLAQSAIKQRSQSFELLGYDIMIDCALNAWIIEVNMSPAM